MTTDDRAQWPGQQLASQDEAAPEYGPAPQLLCDSQMHCEPSHAQPLQDEPLEPVEPDEPLEPPELDELLEPSTIAMTVAQLPVASVPRVASSRPSVAQVESHLERFALVSAERHWR